MKLSLVATLQQALQSNASDRVREAALAPLLDAYNEPLVRFARQKLRQSTRPLGLDVEDLVQEAWTQLILRLQKVESAPIRDDDHAFYFLRRVVLSRFLDAIDKQPVEANYELDAPFAEDTIADEVGTDRLFASDDTRAEASLFFAQEGTRERMLHALFESEEAFRSVCTEPPRRRVRQYQATVLYYLLILIEEMASGEKQIAVVEKMATLIGIPRAMQEKIKRYLPIEEIEAIAAAVNAICETKIENTQNFGKIRYELNQLCRLRKSET
jgi:DNA-directed RNA polymerase specialized sigma24 family protein